MARSDQQYVLDTKHDRYPVAAHLILRDPAGRVLLMRRAGSGYGDGMLALPAGHIDRGETATESVTREIKEELGITPAAPQPAGVMFRMSDEPRVDFFFTTTAWEGTPQIREPHKCTQLIWADPADLPPGVLDYVAAAISNAQTGKWFSEPGW
jgi:8-oxo-dGTP pyrophosphatase MutT (NUDIX family)